ncbi:MAG: hypothetical protein WCG05_00485 [Alphaproteobacteria bacterium]
MKISFIPLLALVALSTLNANAVFRNKDGYEDDPDDGGFTQVQEPQEQEGASKSKKDPAEQKTTWGSHISEKDTKEFYMKPDAHNTYYVSEGFSYLKPEPPLVLPTTERKSASVKKQTKQDISPFDLDALFENLTFGEQSETPPVSHHKASCTPAPTQPWNWPVLNQSSSLFQGKTTGLVELPVSSCPHMDSVTHAEHAKDQWKWRTHRNKPKNSKDQNPGANSSDSE